MLYSFLFASGDGALPSASRSFSSEIALFAAGFTWFLTALGASFVFIYKNVNDKAFSFMMSSAAGIMLASTFFSLLMPAMDMVEEFSYLILTCGFVLGAHHCKHGSGRKRQRPRKYSVNRGDCKRAYYTRHYFHRARKLPDEKRFLS